MNKYLVSKKVGVQKSEKLQNLEKYQKKSEKIRKFQKKIRIFQKKTEKIGNFSLLKVRSQHFLIKEQGKNILLKEQRRKL